MVVNIDVSGSPCHTETDEVVGVVSLRTELYDVDVVDVDVVLGTRRAVAATLLEEYVWKSHRSFTTNFPQKLFYILCC